MTEGKANESVKEKKEPALEGQASNDVEIMKSLKIGSIDNIGNTVTNIFVKNKDYVIYEIKTDSIADSLRVFFVDELSSKFDKVRLDYVRAKGLLCKANDSENIKARIASILSHALSLKDKEDDKNNENVFEELINKVKEDYIEQYKFKLRYLYTIFLLTIGVIIFSLYVYSNITLFCCLDTLILNNPGLKTLIYVITAGGVGGFLSVSYRLKEVKFEFQKLENIEKNDNSGEKNEKKKLALSTTVVILSGVERFFISILGAVIVYIIIKSKLLLGIENPSNYIYVLFSLLAGFSETFVPNLLVKLEKKTTE